MIQDVVKISEKIFSYFLEKDLKISSPKSLYVVYHKLNKVIENSECVANHYLALTFEEYFLQNSSLGTPQDKWRYFLNIDLERLNKTLKDYLLMLTELSFESEDKRLEDSFIYNFYNWKNYYSFIRDQYNIGNIPPSSLCLIQCVLNTDFNEQSNKIYIGKNNKIDLSTYEKRKELKNKLLEEINKLENLRDKLTDYLKRKITIDDLLFKKSKRKLPSF